MAKIEREAASPLVNMVELISNLLSSPSSFNIFTKE
jgi:hypothetical protein